MTAVGIKVLVVEPLPEGRLLHVGPVDVQVYTCPALAVGLLVGLTMGQLVVGKLGVNGSNRREISISFGNLAGSINLAIW